MMYRTDDRRTLISGASLSLLFLVPLFLSLMIGSSAGSLAFEQDRLVNQDVASANQDRPDIASDKSDVYIVWQDRRSGDWDIYCRASHDGGTTYGPEVRVDDTLANKPTYDDRTNQESPRVGVDPDGKVHVAWQDDREGRPLIYHASSSDGGSTFSPNALVSYYYLGRQTDPDLAISPEGDIGISWEDDREKVTYTQVYVAVAPAGSSFSSPVKASDAPGNKVCVDPALTMPGSGRLHVAWADTRNNNSDIYMSSSFNLGASFSKSLMVSKDTSETEQELPAVCSNSTHIYAAWKDPRTGSGDIYYSYSTDRGSTFIADGCIHASDTKGYQYQPQIEMNASGSVHFVWTTTPGRSDPRADVRMTVMSANGTKGEVVTVNEPVQDSSQDQPSLCVGANGKTIIVWTDDRRGNKDIYMTRTTESGETGAAPAILDPRVSPEIGIVGTRFTFAMTYVDPEGDLPEPGYPKVEVFYKGIGTEPIEYPGSPFTMNMRMMPAPDFDYTNGETYLFMLTPDRPIELYHRFVARAQTGNRSIVSTEMRTGPRLDSKGPVFGPISPPSGVWQLKNIVQLSINISDDLSGVDPWSTYYQVYNPISMSWEPWQRKGDSYPTGPSSVNYRVNVTFREGAGNLIRFRAKDMMGNGADGKDYSESAAFPVWVDVSGPVFELEAPLPDGALSDPFLELGLRVRDEGKGVDPSTVEVTYTIAGTDAYGPWNTLEDLRGTIEEDEEAEGEYLVSFDLSLEYGYSNYVKVRAKDLLGNEADSGDIQFTILEDTSEPGDRPPSPVGSVQPRVSGSVRPHITWAQSFDPDGDLVTYFVRILDVSSGLPVVDWYHMLTGETFFDPPADKLLSAGRSYLVQIVPSSVGVNGGRLNGSLTNSTLTISTDANTPPEPVRSMTPKATSESQPVLRWEPSTDPNGDDVYYFLRMGTYSGGADITDWVSLLKDTRYAVPKPLSVGVYHIDMICSDGKDFSPISHFTLSKGIYSPHLETDRTTIVLYKGNSTSVSIKLTNKGFAFDNIALELTGPATEMSTLDIYIENSNIELSAFSSRNTTMRIESSPDVKQGLYVLNITARSLDGVSGYTKTVSVRVVDKNDLDGAPTDDDDDDSRDRLQTYLVYVLIAVLVLIIVAMLYGYYMVERRQRLQEVETIPVRQAARRRDIPPPEPVMEMDSGRKDKPELPPKRGKKAKGKRRKGRE